MLFNVVQFLLFFLVSQFPAENIFFTMYVTSDFRKNVFQNYVIKKEILQQKYTMVVNNPSQHLSVKLFFQ